MALAPDTVLQSRYRIVRKLSAGGMGTVYEAIDQRFDSEVAIKESHFTDDAARKQFEREARLLNRLKHPAMTRVIDHFTEGDGQFLVMDYVEGEDLWEMLRKKGGAFSQEIVLEWANQLLDALHYIHSQQPPIIHRDIKPHNLKLTERGQIILLDFGLAKGTLGQSTSIMTSRSVFGYTPVYAPLEQIHGVGTDPRSDIYSLGATLYHLITGITPIDAPTRFNAIEEGKHDPLRPAHEVNPEVTQEISEIIRVAMAISRRERIASAIEMHDALKAANQNSAEAIDLKDTVLPSTIVSSSPTNPPGSEGNLTETQRLQLEYWTVFKNFLLHTNSFLKSQKPQAQNWFPITINPYFRLEAVIQRKGRKICVYLVSSGPDAKRHFHLLQKDKEAITHEIGDELEWSERQTRKQCYIFLCKYQTNPENRQEWEAQHEWLKEKLELFHRVFAQRIKGLNAADYEPKESMEQTSQITPTLASPIIASSKVASPAIVPSDSSSLISQEVISSSKVFDSKESHYKRKVAWYIYALAVLGGLISGYIALILTRRTSQVGLFSEPITYGLLGVLFGFVWPQRRWKWGLWLSIPSFIFFASIGTFVAGQMDFLVFLALSIIPLITACLCSFIGSRLAARRTERKSKRPLWIFGGTIVLAAVGMLIGQFSGVFTSKVRTPWSIDAIEFTAWSDSYYNRQVTSLSKPDEEEVSSRLKPNEGLDIWVTFISVTGKDANLRSRIYYHNVSGKKSDEIVPGGDSHQVTAGTVNEVDDWGKTKLSVAPPTGGWPRGRYRVLVTLSEGNTERHAATAYFEVGN